ncbi:hypothetical protein Celaphus_00015713 [Cervus elaphus hippelaphus]|uniref:Uncharacterized protein n=1 Tax=Cervus elaphus hippelaphus TaxID=46360 RepID=A0A212C1W8_CEREH|nr:hypothetical protein Celaphus_00015713 [Cervus elaphus hippelaphus]
MQQLTFMKYLKNHIWKKKYL